MKSVNIKVKKLEITHYLHFITHYSHIQRLSFIKFVTRYI
jgi:hypothetical protein